MNYHIPHDKTLDSIPLRLGLDYRKSSGLTHEFWVDRANCAMKRMAEHLSEHTTRG